MPEIGRTHPAVNGMGSENDHQGDGIEPYDTARAEVAAGFENAVLSGLLRCTAAEAAPIVAGLDPGMFASPCRRFAFLAVCAAVADGTDPSPVAAADAALATGVPRPPAWHNCAVCEMSAIAYTPAGPALPNLPWHADRLAAYATQRAAEMVLRSGLDRLARADDLTELAALLRAQADRLQLLAGVGR